MNRDEERRYQNPYALKEILHWKLHGKKFVLLCGHHITFGKKLGNNLTVRKGRDLRGICAACGY